MKNVALYCRVSTSEQSPEMQQDSLLEYAKRRNWQVYREYVDQGISGTVESRPALNDLMADARKGKFDIVMVWRFDRFARSLAHLIEALNEFSRIGIDFISYTENIDTTTASGRLVFSMIGAIAEFERCLIRDRVKAGIDRAKRNGVKLGRPRKGFDYKRALQLRDEGWSFRRIAKEMSVSSATVFKAIT